MTGVRIRPVAARDWDGIVALEAGAYGSGLSEDRAALESRAQASPGTCFVLDVEDEVAGYVLSLPYPRFRCPDLTRPERSTFRSANLHLHDMVVAAGLRGRGLAKQLLRHLTATADALGYERISLVAVGGSTGFWSARGYANHPEVALPGSYGADAVYMSRAM
jgi:GNAT superfamily N-acetyltransferase